MEQFRFFNEHVLVSNFGRVSFLKYKNNKAHTTFGGVGKDDYLRVRINGKDYQMHRLVWNVFNGEIPDGYVVHHLDENKQNNKIENLSLMSNFEHNSMHKIGNKNTFGFRHTEESKQKMSENRKGKCLNNDNWKGKNKYDKPEIIH